jgi:hypothetical protein
MQRICIMELDRLTGLNVHIPSFSCVWHTMRVCIGMGNEPQTSLRLKFRDPAACNSSTHWSSLHSFAARWCFHRVFRATVRSRLPNLMISITSRGYHGYRPFSPSPWASRPKFIFSHLDNSYGSYWRAFSTISQFHWYAAMANQAHAIPFWVMVLWLTYHALQGSVNQSSLLRWSDHIQRWLVSRFVWPVRFRGPLACNHWQWHSQSTSKDITHDFIISMDLATVPGVFRKRKNESICAQEQSAAGEQFLAQNSR